ncbi:MAG: hypothetical protein ABIK83_11225 [Candidatus Zixiibacteriota bacterium]
MKTEKSRNKDEIFAEMHRELRKWNPDVPESSERLDPILRMLLQMQAHQLERIEDRVMSVWEVAKSSLIRSLFPECKRWPVPAFTIMSCELTDPTVEVDPRTLFIYREKRDGGETFFFSPHRTEKLMSAKVRHVLLRYGDELKDVCEDIHPVSQAGHKAGSASSIVADRIYVAIEYSGIASDFKDSLIYLNGSSEVLRQLRWSYWCPGMESGAFSTVNRFCPGLETSIEDIFRYDDESTPDWGGLRSSSDLYSPLEDSFVIPTESFVSAWERGPANREIADLMFKNGIEITASEKDLFWIRLDLPEGGDRGKLTSRFGIRFNCFVATNKNELTLFKHTGGNKLVEIELPDRSSSVLEIVEVTDSSGRTYLPSYEVQTEKSPRVYSIEEREDRQVLWFDFSPFFEPPPDSLTVNYSVTAENRANGIEAGKIDELYEKHPGLTAVTNILPTRGGVPAKTAEQIMIEATGRLRSRDRAVNFKEISAWMRTFDPRIQKAECRNSTERTKRGVRRCIAVTATVKADDFLSEDEVALLRIRLTSFLKAKSPVNTQYKVEITRQ